MPAIRPAGWSWSQASFPGEPGKDIPDSLADLFQDETLQLAVMDLNRIKRSLERARQSWNPYLAPRICDLLEEASALISGSMPDSVCGSCSGIGCEHCMSGGWIPLMLKGE